LKRFSKIAAVITALLVSTIGIGAADIESQEFADFLRGLPGPGAPRLYEDAVVFTASSRDYHRVGIAFAHEGYAPVHWFQNLVTPVDPSKVTDDDRKKGIHPNEDTGILFHVQVVPDGLDALDYRLVVDGLWTADPLNPVQVQSLTGFTASRVLVPARLRPPSPTGGPAGSLRFTFDAPPGEIVTVAGSFNNWDPFMYRLDESAPGVYTLTLALPPGLYEYVFYCRGARSLDPYNPAKLYARGGEAVSVARVE